jgi:hypothetical protein
MRFLPDDDERILRGSVAQFAASALAGDAAAFDDAGRIPAAVWSSAGALGFLAPELPESSGGLGLSALSGLAVLEELARGSASAARLAGLHALAAAGWAAAGGEVDAGWLEGTTLAAWAPAGLGDVTLQDGRLRGLVQGVPGAAAEGASLLIPVPSDAGDGPRGLLRLPLAHPGVRRCPAPRALGLRAAALADVELADIDVAQLQRAPGTVTSELWRRLEAREWLDRAAIACGIGRAAVAAGAAYAKERVQFGRPIARFQAVQWKLANGDVDTTAAELLVRRAAARPGDVAAAGQAFAFATAAAVRVAHDVLQVYGGYGYTREFPAERWLRDAKALQIASDDAAAPRLAAAEELRRRLAEA